MATPLAPQSRVTGSIMPVPGVPVQPVIVPVPAEPPDEGAVPALPPVLVEPPLLAPPLLMPPAEIPPLPVPPLLPGGPASGVSPQPAANKRTNRAVLHLIMMAVLQRTLG